MKIELSNSTLVPLVSGAQRATNSSAVNDVVGAVQPVGAAGAHSATVSLSSMSAVRAASGSDIDTAKVESIKAALRDGSYKIDSGKIADGMLSSARELLKARTR